MRRRYGSRMAGMEHIVFVALLCFNGIWSCPVIAQQDGELGDEIYEHEALQQIDSLLQTKYVLPEKAMEYADEFRKKYQTGYYNSYTDPKAFADQVTADLINITNDKHIKFRVIESSRAGETPESPLHHPIRYHILGINENKGFSKLEWIDGNVGYFDIRRFYNYPDIKDLIVGAMNFLANANAIIIDIRENQGGSGDFLSSYFLEYPTQLNGWYSREDDFLTEFWTSKEVGAERLTEVPVFVLTSDRTFSAAESFAYDMKVRKRATLIGEPTKGGAHSVDLYRVGDQFEIYIPTARAINPVTGTNWEGKGVIPEIIVPSEAALDTAIVLAKKAGTEFAKAKEAKLEKAVEDMEFHMDRAEGLFREGKNDGAVAALDSMFQIADENGLINEFFMDVLAYEYQTEEDEQILYAVLAKKIEFFPRSPTAYESLAYAYYKNDKKELAVANFEAVLELAPDDRNAMKMIKRIRGE